MLLKKAKVPSKSPHLASEQTQTEEEISCIEKASVTVRELHRSVPSVQSVTLCSRHVGNGRHVTNITTVLKGKFCLGTGQWNGFLLFTPISLFFAQEQTFNSIKNNPN